jgi:hypothetical protein
MHASAVPFVDKTFTRTLADAFPPLPADDTLSLIGQAALKLYAQSGTARLQPRAPMSKQSECDAVTGHDLIPSSYPTRHKAKDMKLSAGVITQSVRSSVVPQDDREVARQVGALLVVDFGHYRSTHKVIASKAGTSPRAAEKWTAGDSAPSLPAFLRLLPHSPSLQSMCKRLMGLESELSPDFTRELNELITRHMR